MKSLNFLRAQKFPWDRDSGRGKGKKAERFCSRWQKIIESKVFLSAAKLWGSRKIWIFVGAPLNLGVEGWTWRCSDWLANLPLSTRAPVCPLAKFLGNQTSASYVSEIPRDGALCRRLTSGTGTPLVAGILAPAAGHIERLVRDSEQPSGLVWSLLVIFYRCIFMGYARSKIFHTSWRKCRDSSARLLRCWCCFSLVRLVISLSPSSTGTDLRARGALAPSRSATSFILASVYVCVCLYANPHAAFPAAGFMDPRVSRTGISARLFAVKLEPLPRSRNTNEKKKKTSWKSFHRNKQNKNYKRMMMLTKTKDPSARCIIE